MAILWLLSFAGFVCYFHRVHRLALASAPLFSASVIVLTLTLCGVLGVLYPGALALLMVGLALGGFALWKRRGLPKTGEWIGAALFALACALLYARYRASLLVSYDDFSHWGMMARQLLTHDALPDQSAVLIAFQSYPPAAACWIYYVCRFFGESEGMMLAAQSWLVLMCVLPLLSLRTRENRWSGLIPFAAVALVALSMFQGTASLMVDNLLGALAVGCLCMALNERGSRMTLWSAAPLAMLSLVKDSGLFFAAVVWGLIWLGNQGRKGFRLRFIGSLPALLAVLAARLTWWIHLRLAFPAAQTTKHAFSLANMRKMGADKSYENMGQIAQNVLREALKPDNEALQILALLLLCCAVVAAWRLMARRGSIRREAWLAAGSCVCYGAYLVSLWGMYTFSLPLETALKLVAFERYNSTCAIFLMGALAAYALLAPHTRKSAAALSLLLILPLLIPSWRAGVPQLLGETYRVPLRERMAALESARPLQAGERALVCVSEEDNGSYAIYMSRYQFQSMDVTPVSESTYTADLLQGVSCVYEAEPLAALEKDVEETQGEIVIIHSEND